MWHGSNSAKQSRKTEKENDKERGKEREGQQPRDILRVVLESRERERKSAAPDAYYTEWQKAPLGRTKKRAIGAALIPRYNAHIIFAASLQLALATLPRCPRQPLRAEHAQRPSYAHPPTAFQPPE